MLKTRIAATLLCTDQPKYKNTPAGYCSDSDCFRCTTVFKYPTIKAQCNRLSIKKKRHSQILILPDISGPHWEEKLTIPFPEYKYFNIKRLNSNIGIIADELRNKVSFRNDDNDPFWSKYFLMNQGKWTSDSEKFETREILEDVLGRDLLDNNVFGNVFFSKITYQSSNSSVEN